jgi:hypothetical protein
MMTGKSNIVSFATTAAVQDVLPSEAETEVGDDASVPDAAEGGTLLLQDPVGTSSPVSSEADGDTQGEVRPDEVALALRVLRAARLAPEMAEALGDTPDYIRDRIVADIAACVRANRPTQVGEIVGTHLTPLDTPEGNLHLGRVRRLGEEAETAFLDAYRGFTDLDIELLANDVIRDTATQTLVPGRYAGSDVRFVVYGNGTVREFPGEVIGRSYRTYRSVPEFVFAALERVDWWRLDRSAGTPAP